MENKKGIIRTLLGVIAIFALIPILATVSRQPDVYYYKIRVNRQDYHDSHRPLSDSTKFKLGDVIQMRIEIAPYSVWVVEEKLSFKNDTVVTVNDKNFFFSKGIIVGKGKENYSPSF